jgi:8-oxo-dGTP pyrophosphatase MutT (NUDIX family)
MSELTHAGGIVMQFEEGTPRYLIITAKTNFQRWVLPKGHIQPGETTPAAAEREVLEEAGVEAKILESVGSTEVAKEERIIFVEFFLMQYIGDKGPGEGRQRRWCSYEEALVLLSSSYTRDMLRRSHLVALNFVPKPEPAS